MNNSKGLLKRSKLRGYSLDAELLSNYVGISTDKYKINYKQENSLVIGDITINNIFFNIKSNFNISVGYGLGTAESRITAQGLILAKVKDVDTKQFYFKMDMPFISSLYKPYFGVHLVKLNGILPIHPVHRHRNDLYT